MQLAVSSRSSLDKFQACEFSYVVSLPDPGTESDPLPLPATAKKVLQLRFHDVDDIEMLAPQYRKCRAPQLEHIEQIIRFFKEIQEAENGSDQFAILVHCEAGLSRSSASSIIGLTCLGYDADTAFDVVCNANPRSVPNRRMLRLADEIFQDTHLCQIAEARRTALFEYAGYEDPVIQLDRNYKRSLRYHWDNLLKRFAHGTTRKQ